jgi:hypothetical protein
MKTNKSYKEAILRAYTTEKDSDQSQGLLFGLRQQVKGSKFVTNTKESKVIESPKNIMQSWLNLRGLDQNLSKDEKDPSNKT